MIAHRIPLITLLKQIDQEDAKLLIVAIAKGAISSIKDGGLSIADSERLIFNLDILMYSDKCFNDKALFKVISYGMELEDIEQLVMTHNAVIDACVEIEELLSKIDTQR